MKKKAFILTRDYKAPYVVATGIPHKPTAIKAKLFRKGEIINGDLKMDAGRPAFVLVGSTMVVPLEVVEEVVTKKVSAADGHAVGTAGSSTEEYAVTTTKAPLKIRYSDAVVIGAIVGAVGVYLAEKKGWITNPNPKNKLYGALAGIGLGIYLVHRSQRTNIKTIVK